MGPPAANVRRGSAILALLLAACTPAGGGATSTTTTTPGTSTTTTTSAPVPTVDPPCLAGPQPFVASGGAGIIERDDSDADVVSRIRWDRYDGCERVIVEFSAQSGAPALFPPGVGPLFIRSAGVLRLQLDPAVSGSAILDQVIDGDLVSRAFVVRRPAGDLFVDLHLASAAQVRVSVASGPARIVVDAIAGGDPYPAPALVTESLVIVDPVGGSLIYPFTVNGYVRGRVEAVTVSMDTAEETVSFSGESAPRPDTWGAFTVLVPDGPVGGGTMAVGELELPVELS